MRTLVLDKATNVEELRARLLGDRPFPDGALDRLKSLNPHLTFKRIPAGSVVLVPDLPGLHKDAGSSVTADPFDGLSETLLSAMDEAVTRAREGAKALLAEQKEVSAAIKSAAFRRAIETDPELKEQAEAAAQVFKQDQEDAKANADSLKALRQEAAAELAALGKLLK